MAAYDIEIAKGSFVGVSKMIKDYAAFGYLPTGGITWLGGDCYCAVMYRDNPLK